MLNRIGDNGSPCFTPLRIGIACVHHSLSMCTRVVQPSYRSATSRFHSLQTPILVKLSCRWRCPTVSNALAKSRKATEQWPFFLAALMHLLRRVRFSLQPGADMKPRWRSQIGTASRRRLAMIFVSNLRTMLPIVIGRQFPGSVVTPPFGISIVLLGFRAAGILPVTMQILNISASVCGVSTSLSSASVPTLSGPAAEPFFLT